MGQKLEDDDVQEHEDQCPPRFMFVVKSFVNVMVTFFICASEPPVKYREQNVDGLNDMRVKEM
jgi:hypothetical protein